MNKKHLRLVAATGLAIGGLAVGVTAVAAQSSPGQVEDADDTNEGPDIPITGPDRASAVALEFTGEGRVTATEIEDEESYYEVEVT